MKKKEGLKIVKGILAAMLNAIPIFLAVCILYAGILKYEPVWWKYILTGMVPCLFFLIRYLEVHLVIFFSLHIGITMGISFLAKTLDERILTYLILIIFLTISVYTKVVKKQPEEVILFPAVTFLTAFVAYSVTKNSFGNSSGDKIIAITITYVILYFVYQYQKGYLEYLRNNEVSTKYIPRKNIFLTGWSAMSGFLVLFLGMALFVAKKQFLSGGLSKIKDWISRFFIWLLHFAKGGIEQGNTIEETVDEIQYLEGIAEETEHISHLPDALVKAIDYTVTIGAYLICITAIVMGAVAVIKVIWLAFQGKKEKTADEETKLEDKITKIERKHTTKRKKQKLFTIERKIRKLYEDLIIRTTVFGKKEKLEKNRILKGLRFKTPTEQCEGFIEKNNIRYLYEKTRYSGKQMSKEELKKMRELCLKEKKNNFM